MIIIIIIIIMSLFNEDNIFSKYTYLAYGPLKGKKFKFNIIIYIYTKSRRLGDLTIVCVNMTTKI